MNDVSSAMRRLRVWTSSESLNHAQAHTRTLRKDFEEHGRRLSIAYCRESLLNWHGEPWRLHLQSSSIAVFVAGILVTPLLFVHIFATALLEYCNTTNYGE